VVRLEVSGAGAGRQSRSSFATNFAATIIVRAFGVSRVHFFKDVELAAAV
jgi:hypothetical protein